jgi:hypothetical protein
VAKEHAQQPYDSHQSYDVDNSSYDFDASQRPISRGSKSSVESDMSRNYSGSYNNSNHYNHSNPNQHDAYGSSGHGDRNDDDMW